MDSCDVLIVGGGPAGSSCAWGLRSSGLDVIILDRSTFPRDKLCGGWITPFVLRALEIDPDVYARGRVFQPITGFRVSCMGQCEVEIRYGQTVSYGIRRCEFDEYLLRRSRTRMREGVTVTSIERSGDGWIVNGEIKTRLLVGAGGHFCPISRFICSDHVAQPVVAQEIEFEMKPEQAASCPIRPEIPELYFCCDMQGYGWCFRKRNFLNIGLGRLDRHALRDHVSRFLQFLVQAGKLRFNLSTQFAGHAYLLFGHSRRKLVDDSVLLAGDSAGLAYPQSGEGIRPAVESGILAAEVIKSVDGNYTRDQLGAYAKLLAARFSNGHGHLEAMARHLPSKLRDACARLLLTNELFCRRVVLENWFLHTHDRPLDHNTSG